MQDILNSIKVALHDRATSPLFISFTISFLTINYKMVFVLLSHSDIVAAIDYIDDELYRTATTKFLFFAAYPLIATTLYLLAYPWPARWALRYQLWQKRITTEVQREMLELEVLDQEQSAKLKTYHNEIEDRYSKLLAEKRSEVSSLERTVREQKELIDKLTEASKHDTPPNIPLDIKAQSEVASAPFQITYKGQSLHTEELEILALFEEQDTISYIESLRKLSLSSRALEVNVNRLSRKGLLICNEADDFHNIAKTLEVTDAGKEFLYENRTKRGTLDQVIEEKGKATEHLSD